MPRLLYLSLVISAIRKQFETSMEVPILLSGNSGIVSGKEVHYWQHNVRCLWRF